jgi:(1->4)-alpha-D-glucan 1-alpha-D-glucosylmutase
LQRLLQMLERRAPATTYRLQFNASFTFRDAAALVPYLAVLGITDAYASPLLKSRPGSLHGYDICDHRLLDPELGSREDFEVFVGALRQHSMGLIVDIVPNHMGLDVNANSWWRDVLEHGPSSAYADFFDIDWDPVTPELADRVLVPLLQDGYGDALHRGELTLGWDGRRLQVQYLDHRLPVEPRSSARVLRGDSGALARLQMSDAAGGRDYADVVGELESLPPFQTRDASEQKTRREVAARAADRLGALVASSPALEEHLAASIAQVNGNAGVPETFDRLHALLEEQPYRLAHWRTAFDEINYRRFFAVNDLGGLRMERADVFDATHALILELVRTGRITGLRIDHPDGLLDPAEYFRQLERAALRLPGDSALPLYIVIEKILAADEGLPESWPVAGTTGYGFLSVINGQFVDGSNERQMRGIYERLTGDRTPFVRIALEAKHHVMASSLASELTVLARALTRVAKADRATRDFTVNALRQTLVEVLACFPVYRTYVDQSGLSASDLHAIDFAIDRARQGNRTIPAPLFLFLRNVLVADRRFAMKFQQLSAPVQAKGVEDTGFYRSNILLSLNEVGGDPSRFGRSVEELHEENRVRLESWPLELLASSTHDTKRGEDVRARLNVLSEIPQRWRPAVAGWMRMNAPHRTAVDREPAPDRRDEYLFYQSLLGIWPAEREDDPIPLEAPRDIVTRVQQFLQKAVKEAKLHTSWVNPNVAYEDATSRFVNTVLAGPAARDFLHDFVPFARWVSAKGVVNSLAQLVLKLASPGVADFYQGTEIWALDLADPDNRRPVDFAWRGAMLDELMPSIAAAEASCAAAPGTEPAERSGIDGTVARWLESWPDGRLKMFVTAAGIRCRRRAPDLFTRGSYQPLHADGEARPHVIAFGRQLEQHALIAVVPRLTSLGPRWPTGEKMWGDSRIALPSALTANPDDSFSTRIFTNIFTGADVIVKRDAKGAYLQTADVLSVCPVAMLLAR